MADRDHFKPGYRKRRWKDNRVEPFEYKRQKRLPHAENFNRRRGRGRYEKGESRWFDPNASRNKAPSGDFRGYEPDEHGNRASNRDVKTYSLDEGGNRASNRDVRTYSLNEGGNRASNRDVRMYSLDEGGNRASNRDVRTYSLDEGGNRASNRDVRMYSLDEGGNRAPNRDVETYSLDEGRNRTSNRDVRTYFLDEGGDIASNGDVRTYSLDEGGNRASNRDVRTYSLDEGGNRASNGDVRTYSLDEGGNRALNRDVRTYSLDEGGNRAQTESQHGECTAYKLLNDIEQADPKQILMKISNEHNEFWSLLNNKPHSFDELYLLLSLAARSCQSKSTPEILYQFLSKLNESSFLTHTVLQYITGLIWEKPSVEQEKYFKPLQNLVCVLSNLIEGTPAAYVRVFPLISTLKFVAQTMHPASGAAEVNEELTDIMRRQKGHEPRELCRTSQFRTIPVFPTSGDLHLAKPPELRPNKTTGQYESITEYLEVQFRLLREDFVGPLRDGLNDYLEPKTQSSDSRKPNQIRVYHGVHVLNPICTSTGLAYRICFDVARLRYVRWEATKRLIFGSLVCLSRDNFKTLLFATVSDRDPKRLKDGEVTIVFQDNSQVSAIPPDETFSMIESSAYFEAYRHVLKGLQTITDGSFPFHKYLVSCRRKVAEPYYLQETDAVYDIQCLGGEHKAVPIFEDRKWPSMATLNLDASQLDALKAALRREFTVIQGPPGTGKTFVGLKIVSTLLDNKHIWCDPNEGNSPILLVCYTNHALDQFLEGIQKYCPEKMVRVGSRSQSKMLQQYCLGNLRKVIREKKQVSQSIYDDRRKAHKSMSTLKNKIQKNSALIEASERGVLHEDVLEPFIGKDNLTALKKRAPNAACQHPINNDKPSALLEWLKVHELIGAADSGSKHLNADAHMLAAEVEDFADALYQSRMSDRDIWTGYTNDDDALVREQEHKTAGEKTLAVNFDDFFRSHKAPSHVGQERTLYKAEAIERVRSGDRMTRDDLRAVKDVWNLPVSRRWRLYRHWLNEYRRQLRQGIQQFEEEYHQTAERLTEILNQEDMAIMKEAAVIGMTTTAAARYRLTLQEIRPKIIVIEEAAEVLEAHIVTTLSAGCEHLILIGDHKQLRPSPNVYELAKKFNLNISLFERMVKNRIPFKSLKTQHRMRPEISRLLEHIYPELENHPSVANYENVRGVAKNVFFIRHQHEEDKIVDMNTFYNVHEAEFVTALCRYLLLQGYKPNQITILTLYTGQLIHLRKHLSKAVFKGVRATAVDNFQGEENDIILLSLVRSNVENRIGFLKEDNRVCVALSRAKVGLFAIGNFDLLAKKSDLWKKLVATLQEMGCIGDSLELSCQNHPNIAPVLVEFAREFTKVPEGGCTSLCGVMLPCGHVCERVCHTYDNKHKEYLCRKTCNRKLCESGHLCPKLCYQDCGLCDVRLEKKIPSCGHSQTMSCHQSPETFTCLYDCNTMLLCGHRYQGSCGEKANYTCTEIVRKVLECGHAVNIECCQREENIKCQVKCNVALDCGHACPGNCASCFRGRLHTGCKSDCSRTLVCGHACLDKCTKNCPPCSRRCENRCIHSHCPKFCGKPCVPCKEPCRWQCEHFKCTKLCHEPCNRPRCNEPCKKLLPCKHSCIGLCGETCPTKCRICDKGEVEEIFFGTEEAEEGEPPPRFVQLEDCEHVLEVSGLDRWMTDDNESVSIQLKSCPKCKTMIRKSLRYHSQVNSMLNNIEKVKKQVIGQGQVFNLEKDKLRQQLAEMDPTTEMRIRRRVYDKNPILTLKSLYAFQNALKFLSFLSKLRTAVEETLRGEPHSPIQEGRMTDILEQVHLLEIWVSKNPTIFSDQELREGSQEILRVSSLKRARDLQNTSERLEKPIKSETKATLYGVIVLLTDGKLFTDPIQEQVSADLETIRHEISPGLSAQERQMIVTAMSKDVRQGAWFKCPNGHYYAIGECGGAMQESKCPDCGSTIGGTRHQLWEGNVVATEMDGARYAAWSEQANMENYDLDNIRF